MPRPVLSLLCLLLLLGGCGYKLGYRHFAGPIVPASTTEDQAQFVIGDDRSITFVKDRLEVSLLPLTTEMLNRQFSNYSKAPEGFTKPNPYATAFNPYTWGDWKPPGEDKAPTRFTVFQLKVKNYAFPKVRIEPSNIELVSPNGRHYAALTLSAMVEYYWPYAVAYGGNSRLRFTERRDILRRTLFTNEMIFSGQEKEGFIVFADLESDVEDFTITINEMALRFDFRNLPVETVDIPYQFQREVYYARQPHPEEQ